MVIAQQAWLRGYACTDATEADVGQMFDARGRVWVGCAWSFSTIEKSTQAYCVYERRFTS